MTLIELLYGQLVFSFRNVQHFHITQGIDISADIPLGMSNMF